MSIRKNRLSVTSLQYSEGFNLNSNSSVSSQISNLSIDSEYSRFETAEVIDVIYSKTHSEFKLNEDLGKVRIRIVERQEDADESSLIWAYPINSAIVQYPIKHEIVYVVQFLGRYFYLGSLNYFNRVNNNIIVGISESPSKSVFDNKKTYDKSTFIPERASSAKSVNIGDTFKDNNVKIKPLVPSEGDTIIRGRFGNNIHLGNNFETNNPNIKISIGQRDEINSSEELESYYEDINKDLSSVWITNDGIIDINPITKNKSYYMKSGKNLPDKFDGNQIIINSDRIIFNSKQNELMLFANKGLILNTNGYIALDSSNDIGLSTLSKFILRADDGTYVDSKEIILGRNAKEPLVLGNELVSVLSDILSEIIKLTVPTGSGPSGNPLNSAKFSAIKSKLKKMLSKQNFTK